MNERTPFNEYRHAQLTRALEGMGNTHTLEDIVSEIAHGRMQSFTEGETWCVTQIINMPRKRILEIILVIGDMPEAELLHDRVMNYAVEHNCSLVRTFARHGWMRKAREYGWKNGHTVFLMEI